MDGRSTTSSGRHLVITVHGIRTFGHWQSRLAALLRERDPGIEVRNYTYGYFSALAFVIPFTRWITTRAFRRRLLTIAARDQWDRIDIVAHSFGTHLVAWALAGLPPAQRPSIHTIVLSGSVLKSTFPWDELLGHSVRRLVNDCGVKDSVLLLNQIVVLFTGMAGRLGFQGMTGSDFQNRFFAFGHSDYFLKKGEASDDFMRERWVPLLTGEGPIPGADERNPPSAFHGLFLVAVNNAEPIKVALWVIPLVLGILWINQQRVEAERQRTIALGTALAAQSQLVGAQTASLLDLSALLAVEGARRAPGSASDRALRQALAVFPVMLLERRAGQPIQAVAISPDGAQVAAGGDDGTVRIWRLATPDSPVEVAHGAAVNTLAYSPDGRRLASASREAVILHATAGGDRNLALPARDVRVLAFGADGRWLVTGGGDGVVSVWNAVTGEKLRSFRSGGSVDAVAVSPDARLVAAGGADNTARVWDVFTGGNVSRVEHEPASASMPLRLGSRDGGVFSVAFDPRGQYLATGAQDGTVRLWNVWTGHEVFRWHHADAVYEVAFSPDGRWLASGGMDETARVWDLSNGREHHRLVHQYVVERVVWDPRGNLLTASGDRTARLWQMPSGRELARMFHSGYVHSTAIDHDGTRVITGAADGSVRVWDVAAAGGAVSLAHADIKDALFSPNGALVVTVGEKSAQLWELPEGRLKHRLPHDDFVSFAAFSPDGRKLVTAAWDGTRVWDTESGETQAGLRHEGEVRMAMFSQDGRLLATAGFADGTARVWNVASAQEVLRVEHPGAVEGRLASSFPRGGVRRLAFAPGGAELATAGHDGTVRLWSIDGGLELLRLVHRGYVQRLDFSHDGRYLVTESEQALHVWSLPEGKSFATLEKGEDEFMDLLGLSPDGRFVLAGSDQRKSVLVYSLDLKEVAALAHEDRVFSAEFTRDGSRLLTASRDKTARIWDTQTWQELTRVTANDFMYKARYAPDEQSFVTASGDGFARAWMTDLATMIDVVCRRLDRNLTADEWRQYLGAEPYAPTCQLRTTNPGK